jgi:SAM-dependent methyltransferase
MRFEADYFADNYRDYAAQNPERKLAFYRRSIGEALAASGHRPREEKLRLLDVGCGLGRFVASLPEERWERHGTDLSEYAVEKDRESYPGVTFRHAGATDRPYPDDHFDVVTAFDVIEHVPDLSGVATAVTSMLRPGGVFAFVVPVYDGLSGPLIRLLDKDPTHVHKEPRDFWLRWAGERFRDLRWRGVLRYLLPGGHYLHVPTRLGRRHTPAILVTGVLPRP